MSWPTTWQEISAVITSIVAGLGFLIACANWINSRRAQISKSNLESSDFALNLKKITDETVAELMEERKERQKENRLHRSEITRLKDRVRDLEEIIRANDKLNMELWIEGSPVMATVKMQQKYRDHWRDKGDWYWFWRLSMEVGALMFALAGFRREGSPRWELMQIGSICLNWMQMHENKKAAAHQDTLPVNVDDPPE